MTALPELATPKKSEAIGQTEMPSFVWPMNEGVLMSSTTRITPTRLEEGPGLIVQTPPDSAFSVRAPISGRMEQFVGMEEESLTTVVLMPDDPSVIVVLGNLASTSHHDLRENEPAEPDAAVEVRAGQIIGSYGSTEKGFTMQIAHLSHDTPTDVPKWELIDPSTLMPSREKFLTNWPQ